METNVNNKTCSHNEIKNEVSKKIDELINNGEWRLTAWEACQIGNCMQHRVFDRTIVIEDFDKCSLCYERFDTDEKHPQKAYYCPDNHRWVCEKCFNDFKDLFDWTSEELYEEPKLDPLSRLTASFGRIVDTDPRPIVVCDCQHTVRYINKMADKVLSGSEIIGRWSILTFEEHGERRRLSEAFDLWESDTEKRGEAYKVFGHLYQTPLWLEMQKLFKTFLSDPNERRSLVSEAAGKTIEMTALRNHRGELMGYYLVLHDMPYSEA
ncbi:MAG: hypothetical protein K6G56_00930 [Clostridiales bacterium]|nr:hypothetical protein [Clostridiales bacterium]